MKQSPDLVRQRRAFRHQQFAGTVDRQHGLLRFALHRNKPGPGTRDRFTDRCGIILVILLPPPIGLDHRHRHQPYLVPQLLQLSRPVVRPTTGFQSDETRRQLGKIEEHFAAAELFPHDHFPVGIHTVYLKAALRDIESDTFHLHDPVPLLGM